VEKKSRVYFAALLCYIWAEIVSQGYLKVMGDDKPCRPVEIVTEGTAAGGRVDLR
jgi:hypothetical protein